MQHINIVKKLCNIKNPVIFDVGASSGNTVLLFLKNFPLCTIYAFEPFSESFKALSKNTSRHAKIHAYNIGLGNTEAVMKFHSNKLPDTNSLLPTDERAADIWYKNVLDTKKNS